MVFSADDRVLIKVLRQEKRYGAKIHRRISQQARFGGSCNSVYIAAGFMTLTSWSHAWSKSGNISTRCSSMKLSGSGVHVFQLAFEHTEDINNNNNNNTSICKAHNVSIRAESEAPAVARHYVHITSQCNNFEQVIHRLLPQRFGRWPLCFCKDV